VLDIRAKEKFGYSPYYFARDLDRQIAARITEGKNLLVVGRPLAGKTRVVYEALKKMDPPVDVYIPKLDDFKMEDLQNPDILSSVKRNVLLLDDIDKYVKFKMYPYLIRDFCQREIATVATCRSGPEYDQFCKLMEHDLQLFGEPVEIGKMTTEQGQTVANAAGRELPKDFDHTVGSLFVPLDAMKERYKACSPEEKAVLRAVKRLYDAGVYAEREVFSISRIKLVCARIELLQKEGHQWRDLLEGLRNSAFFNLSDDNDLRTEETYLQQIIPGSFDTPELLREMAALLADDFSALFGIGNRASNIGDVSQQKGVYKSIAIGANQECVKLRPLAQFPEEYAMTQNNLGSAFRTLAEVGDKIANCHAAIDAHREALRVFTLNSFPLDYSITQNNLGNAYVTLAEVDDRAANCRAAIDAHLEALKVKTLDSFPMLLAMIQNNLGGAFATLASVHDKATNCRAAIGAFRSALRVYKLDRFPLDYAMTQGNLGAAFATLAQVENPSVNCRAAINALHEALEVCTLDRSPMDYARIQNNLGNAFRILAEVEDEDADRIASCLAALNAYHEALKVNTIEQFPIQYALTQNNLANAYWTLAEMENKHENCLHAEEAYKESLRVYTEDEYPDPCRGVKGNLERLYRFWKGK